MRKPGHILVSIAALLTMLGVVFGLLLVPMPVRRSGHWCPSLLDVAMFGPNPSARVKTELGMPLGSFYYACTKEGPGDDVGPVLARHGGDLPPVDGRGLRPAADPAARRIVRGGEPAQKVGGLIGRGRQARSTSSPPDPNPALNRLTLV
jgi:hypothetical protein